MPDNTYHVVRGLLTPIRIEITNGSLQPTHDFERFPLSFEVCVDVCSFFFREVEWVRNITAAADIR